MVTSTQVILLDLCELTTRIFQAFSSILTGTQLKFDASELVIPASSAPLQFPSITIDQPSSAALTISSDSEVAAPLTREKCESLPIVKFTTASSLNLAGIQSFTLKGIAISLDASTKDFFISISGLQTLILENLCLLEDTFTLSEAPPVLFTIKDTEVLTVQSIYISKVKPSSFIKTVLKQSASFQDITVVQGFADISSKVPTFSIQGLNGATTSATVEGVTIDALDKENEVSSLNAFNIQAVSSLSISKIAISSCKFNFKEDLFMLDDIPNIDIQQVMLSDLSINSDGRALFEISDGEEFNFDNIQLTRVVSQANISAVHETGVESTIWYLFYIQHVNAEKHSKQLSNFVATDSNLNYIKLIDVNGDFHSIHLKGISATNTEFRYRFIRFFKAYHYDSVTYDYIIPPTIWTVEDLKFDNCKFEDVNLFIFTYQAQELTEPVLLISEPDIVRITNSSFTNSKFLLDEDGTVTYYSKVFMSDGYRLEVDEFSFLNNIVDYYSVFYLSTRLANLMVTNSQFQGLKLTASYIFRMNYESFQLSHVTFVYYDLDDKGDGIIYAEYAVMYFENSQVQDVTLDKGSYIFSISVPYLFVESSTFSGIVSSEGRLVVCGNFDPLSFSNSYNHYRRNEDWEAQIYPDFPKLLKLIENSGLDDDGSGYEPVYQYRISNNTFTNCRLTGSSTFIKVEGYSFPGSAILFDRNEFTEMDLGPSASSDLIWIVFANHLEFKLNTFVSGRGQGRLFNFATMYNALFTNISSNTLTAMEDPGFLVYRPESIRTFSFSNNVLQDSMLYFTFIDIMPINNEGHIIISNNLFQNISVYSSNLTYYRTNLIYVEVPTAYPDSSVKFSNNTIIDLDFYKKDPYLKLGYANSLLMFSLGTSVFTVENCYFRNTSIKYDSSYLTATSAQIVVHNATFDDITTYVLAAALYILSPNITIQNSKFNNNTASPESVGGALIIEYDDALKVPIDVLLLNNQFRLNSALTGGAVYLGYSDVKLNMTNNSFTENFARQNKSSVFFEQVHFLSMNLEGNTVGVNDLSTDSQEQNWLGFSNCSGDISIVNTSVELTGELISEFLTVENSPKLTINLRDTVVYETEYVDSQDNSTNEHSGIKYFTFADTDSGTLNIEGLTFENVHISEDPVLHLKCSGINNSIHIQDSSFKTLKQHDTQNELYYDFLKPLDGLQIVTYGGLIMTNPLLSKVDCKIHIDILDSIFEDIIADGSGAVLNDLFLGTTSLLVQNTTFQRIHAGQGAAISTFSPDNASDIRINGSSFLDNQVEGYGGAIFNTAARLDITYSSFINNSAQYSGGAIYSYYLPNWIELQKDRNNIFHDNVYFVKSGRDIGTRPNFLSVSFTEDSFNATGMQMQTDESGAIHLSNVTSYTFQKSTFHIQIRDELGQLINDISKNPSPVIYFAIEFEGRNKTFTSGNCTISGCFVNDKNIIMNGLGGTSANLHIHYLSRDVNIDTNIIVDMRDCLSGEVVDLEEKTCTLCPPNKYSFDSSETYCRKCPPGAECLGGDTLSLRKGHWRSNTSTDHIYACNDSNGNRCAGGFESTCQKGFQGPACYQCDLDNHYIRQGEPTDVRCGTCPADWQIYTVAVVMGLGTFFYQLYFVKNTIQSNREYYKAIQENKPTGKISTGPYVRMLTTYVQIINIVNSFDTGFEQYLGFATAVGEPISVIYFSVDCLFLRWGISPDNVLKARVLLLIVSPIFKTLIVTLFYYIRWRGKLTSKRRYRFIVTVVSFFILEQPQAVAGLISYSSCAKILSDDDRKFVYGNEFFECNTSSYNSFYSWIVVPSICVYFIVVPLTLFLVLYRSRKNLNNEKLRLTMGMLFNEYRENAYFWGLLIIVFKLLLLSFNQWFSDNIKTKALVLVLIFYMYKLLCSWSQPYSDANMNKAEMQAVYAYLLTVFCSFFFLDNPYESIQVACMIVLLVANLIAIGYIGYQMYLLSKDKIKSGLDLIKTSIARKSVSNSSPESSKASNSFQSDVAEQRDPVDSENQQANEVSIELPNKEGAFEEGVSSQGKDAEGAERTLKP